MNYEIECLLDCDRIAKESIPVGEEFTDWTLQWNREGKILLLAESVRRDGEHFHARTTPVEIKVVRPSMFRCTCGTLTIENDDPRDGYGTKIVLDGVQHLVKEASISPIKEGEPIYVALVCLPKMGEK